MVLIYCDEPLSILTVLALEVNAMSTLIATVIHHSSPGCETERTVGWHRSLMRVGSKLRSVTYLISIRLTLIPFLTKQTVSATDGS